MSPIRTMRVAVPGVMVLASVFATGCPLLEVEVEVESACVTRHGVEVEGATALSSSQVIDTDVELAVDELARLRALDAEVQLVHVRLTPTSGIDDLGFVTSARVTVASANPDAALPTITVVDCGADCGRDAGALLLAAETDVDAMDYIDAGALSVGLEVGGAPPAQAWTLDVEVCTRGRGSASAGL